jgi:hypothetical protein
VFILNTRVKQLVCVTMRFFPRWDRSTYGRKLMRMTAGAACSNERLMLSTSSKP